MGFEDLAAHFDARLKLPINKKTYVIEEPSAELGLRIEAMMAIGFSAAQARREVLGAAFDEMAADGVSWPRIKHAANTAMIDAAAGREAAERHWAGQGNRPAPTDHKPPKATASARSRSTAKASTTRKRASTSGTTSRQA